MKIFWSWQSDTDGRIGRFLVRDALRDAVGRLKESLEIDEPVRDALHIDHDIQGVSGSPDLVPTILAKIDSSEVVIADVTVVGKTVVSTAVHKGLINSNVAIELGYALHAVGDRQVVLVFNQHYGTHEDLPFDLRHKGGAIVFTVSPDADREQIKIEQKQLADRFVNALKPYIQKAATLVAPVAETPSTFCRASYFERTALLAKVGEMGFDQIIYSYNAGPMCYLRLVPASGPKEPIRLAALKAAASIAPLLSRGDGAITEINDYGAIRIEPETYLPKGRSAIKDSTQLFENGEIWSISMGLVKTKIVQPLIGTPPFMHTVEFEQVYYDTLKSIGRFASKHLNAGPRWIAEFGIVGVAGLHLGVIGIDGYLYEKRPIAKDEISYRTTLDFTDVTTVDKVLLEFFTRVHDATGSARRSGYCGFPPGRPGSLPF